MKNMSNESQNKSVQSMTSITRDATGYGKEDHQLLRGHEKSAISYAGQESSSEYFYPPGKESTVIDVRHKTSFCRNFVISTVIIFIIAATVVVINLVFFISVAQYSSSVKVGQLGIASDVIQCAWPHWTHFLSTMVLSENATDYLNDNPKGLPMSVFSLNSRDVKFHTYVDENPGFELALPTNGTSRFIMPYNFYNRPWYLWKNSTIRVSVDIIYTEEPVEAFMYLFKGQDAINDFFDDKEPIPPYEEMVDLNTMTSDSVLWTIKTNDYHYVGILMNGIKGTLVKSNVTFSFLYIDTDDYPWLQTNSTTHLSGVGHSVNLGWSGSSNLTLCHLYPIDPHLLESTSIHINVAYYTRDYVLPVAITPIMVVFALFLLVTPLFGIVYRMLRLQRRGYTQIINS